MKRKKACYTQFKKGESRKNMPISFVKDREEKGKCVREILLDLPEWFGLPESTENISRNQVNYLYGVKKKRRIFRLYHSFTDK